METKISIIIPAYNLESSIALTLDSVCAQTFRDIEIIVVNDGSKDHTGEILDAYAGKDARIHAIHKENDGVTSARLRGVEEATGEWIGFVDGDDVIEPNMYECLLENAQKHRAQISHCGYQMVFPDGHVDFYYNTGNRVFQKGKRGCTDLIEGIFVEPGLCNKIYRKELFDGLEDWIDRTICINEDLLMNFYLFRKADCAVYEDFCPYHYVLRKGSASTAQLNDSKLRDPLRVTHLLVNETTDVPEWNIPALRRLVYQLVNATTMEAGNQQGLVVPFRREAQKELWEMLPKVIYSKDYGLKLKIMALWAAIWPTSYRWGHVLYAKYKRTHNKYKFD